MKALSEKENGTISKQFQYQIPLAAKVLGSIENHEKPVCMAVTTSAGKSIITALVLDGYFKDRPGQNAVFLGSNQTVLAQQFHDVLSNCPLSVNFSYSTLKDSKATQLKIGLPQQLIKKPRKMGLLVLDEAQILWQQANKNPNSMMAKILELCQPEAILLLTGSPSYFTARKEQYTIHYLSYEDIPNNPARVFSKVDMDLVAVESRNNIDDCIKTFWRSANQKRDDLSQLAVIARNVSEAENVKQVLEEKYRLRCQLSTSHHDADSANLEDFKTGKYDCIITVNRIIAGWSYNNLTCVLDLAASKNLNRSFQLFSRLLRVKNDHTVKTYYRLCLRQDFAREIKALHQIRSLLDRETYTTYTKVEMGKNPLLKAV